jgi:hypothetical protein
MSLGSDLKEIFTEMGRAYTVYHEGAEGSTEYGEIIPNSQATKPFIVLNFLKMNVAHDTSLVGGDHVVFADSSDYMVTAKNGDYVENAVIKYECVLYKTNDTVLVERFSEEEVNYVDEITSAEIDSDVPVLLTEALREQELDVDDIGTFERHGMELYVSSYVGIQVGDIITDSGGTKYKATVVIEKRFNNVHIVKLDIDNRD